jgi:hypothetical protein
MSEITRNAEGFVAYESKYDELFKNCESGISLLKAQEA